MKNFMKRFSAFAAAFALLVSGSVISENLTAKAASCSRCNSPDAYVEVYTAYSFANGRVECVHCKRCNHTSYNYYRW